ncbi:MAG TPA: replication-associated recombination protein A [Polyangiaceae bacterium]|nr:replication-associated recombination protein A [Polyangiaceae bacterium]
MPRAKIPKSGGAQDETLFTSALRRDPNAAETTPLADRMRPRTLDELVGQAHLVGQGKLLGQAIAEQRTPSMILWGPPGSGKTTIARIVAETAHAPRPAVPSDGTTASEAKAFQAPIKFVPFSAVLGGIPELRVILEEAKRARAYEGARTILFIDEIHRFNKAQQDAFLPHVEQGTVTLIGATTENPSFAVNAALLSRCRVFRLEPLTDVDLALLLRRALADETRGLGAEHMTIDDDAIAAMATSARGDARRALSMLEMTASHVRAGNRRHITSADLAAANEANTLLYDKSGEEHYNVTSAFIKSMRGSDPDAALYYMMRMVESGDDPLFILRRMLIFASEDIGNADPRALSLATAADEAFRRMGMPEGIFPMAHACLYLAAAPKSDGVKKAIGKTSEAISAHGALPVPMKLRNAVTGLMRREGYGQGYRYAHDFEDHVAPGETYLPDALSGTRFYEPSDEGLEKAIKERLARIRER